MTCNFGIFLFLSIPFVFGENSATHMHSDFKIYTFATPDQTQIAMSVLDQTSVREFFHKKELFQAPERYQLNNGHTVYSNADHSVFLEMMPDRTGFVFFSYTVYSLYKEGVNYWEVLIFCENDNSIYLSFRLRPDKVISFLKGGHKPLPGYKAFDNYEPIELPGGEVLFLRERAGKLYDAYWYPSVKDFDYSYQSFAY
jgi:hypothetical protein